MRIINPADGAVIRELAEDEPGAVAGKVGLARAAQPAWALTPLAQRLAVVRRFRELVVAQTPELARTTTREMGKPITQARRELEGLLGRIDFFLEHVERELADEVVLSEPELEERITHEPLGVIANVSAWNYPYFVGMNVLLPALLTGNAVVYKPSEYATLTGLELVRALHDSGLPEGVLSAVVGGGRVGAALLEQRVDGVFFTGSHATGVEIARAVAPKLVRLQLELGGKDPVYVCDDVDVASVAPAIADGAFYNTGQSCCAVERVYVHERVWQPFVERFVSEVQGFKLGDPFDEQTYIGPLARRELALGDLERHVADARDKGAELLTGGRRVDRPGWYFEPTVVVGVTHEMLVMNEESFGPIIGLMKVTGDEDAAQKMADTRYGLTAAVYSRDRGRAERLLRRLPVGSAYWNCCDRVSPRLPWSGRRDSGMGCTLSTYGIEAFLQPKAFHLRSAR
jgi:acyl-CoA reductase-like NAD-dependent aldehyde dehydrogenase